METVHGSAELALPKGLRDSLLWDYNSRYVSSMSRVNYLRLILQILNLCGVFQSFRLGTEQYNRFEAGELSGIDENRFEAGECVMKCSDVLCKLRGKF